MKPDQAPFQVEVSQGEADGPIKVILPSRPNEPSKAHIQIVSQDPFVLTVVIAPLSQVAGAKDILINPLPMINSSKKGQS